MRDETKPVSAFHPSFFFRILFILHPSSLILSPRLTAGHELLCTAKAGISVMHSLGAAEALRFAQR